MAVPTEFTTLDISGKFILNKSLSDDTEQILVLQGVGWLTRKAIGAGTLVLQISHYKDDAAVEHIDIDQSVGIVGSREERTLDWDERESKSNVFGPVIGRSKRVKVDELDIDYLKNGWTEDTIEKGLIESYVVSNTAQSNTTWVAHQTWGIQDINSERRYTRHVKFTGPKGENIEARMVYDYSG